MRLIYEHQVVAREELEERRWCIARLAARHVHRVVLDTIHESDLREHLHVILGTHFYTLSLDELAHTLKVLDLSLHLSFYLRDDLIDDGLTRDEVLRREDDDLISVLEYSVCEVLRTGYLLERISEKLQAIDLLTRARPYLECISEHMEHPRLKVGSRPTELEIHEARDDGFEWILFSYPEPETVRLIFIDLTDTIDTRYGCDDDDVFPREETLGRSMTESVDFFIYGGFFLDV